LWSDAFGVAAAAATLFCRLNAEDSVVAATHRKKFPAPENIRVLLEEARVVLPGIQVLFGFQLISVFSDRFQRLSSLQRSLHFLALIASVISAILVMTPAAHQRIAEKWQASSSFLRGSSYLLAAAMAFLLISLMVEIWVVATIVFDTRAIAWIAAIGIACLGTSLWFAWPLSMKNLD
jgi:hypothetical protein